MVGNVSGVSQLLETMGAPGPQQASESAPSQNFAAVMQQAGNEAGTPLPTPSSSAGTRQAEEDASARSTTTSTQTSSASSQNTAPQTAGPGKSAATQAAGRSSGAGQSPSNVRSTTQGIDAATALAHGTAIPIAVTSAPVIKRAGDQAKALTAALTKTAQANLAKNSASSTVDETVTAASLEIPSPLTAGQNLEASLTKIPAFPAVATPGSALSGDQSVAAAGSGELSGEVAATLKNLTGSHPAVQETGAQPRVGKETVAGKQTPKTSDSKLAVASPQVAVGASLIATPVAGAGTTTVAIPATPVPLALSGPDARNASNSFSSKTDLASAPVAVAASASLPGSVHGTPVRTIDPKLAPTGNDVPAPDLNTASLASPLAAPATNAASSSGPSLKTGTDLGAAPVTASLPAAGTSTASLSGRPERQPISTGLPATGEAISSAASSTGVLSSPVQISQTLAANSIPNQTSTGVETAASKPGTTTSRNALSTAKSTAPTAVSTSAPAETAPRSPATIVSHASSQPVAAAQSVQPAAARTAAATADHKPTSKPADPEVATAQPAGLAAKAAPSTDSLSPAVATTKVSPDAALPAVATQAVVTPGAPAVMVTPVAGAVPTAPLAHTPVSATLPAGSAATASGTQESTATEAVGSLSHTTLSSTPTSLEVGVSSGTHGWLKIRAELNAAGEVDASLTGANSAAASKLRGDLPALSSYLQGEKVQMGALDVRSALHTAFESGSTFSQTGSGGAAGAAVSADAGAAGGRAQQQASQQASQQRGTESVPVLNGGLEGDEVLLGRIPDLAGYGVQTELGGSEGSPSVGYGAGGGWLNVRA